MTYDIPFSNRYQDQLFAATNRFLTKDSQPWYPLMGEFHYSRYPKADWLMELYKIKSGGLNVVASYTIWIHHEEEKGQWDFSNNRDLRCFIQYCQQAGLYFFLRIGPWIHGEVRNGGFPDWLIDRPIETRTNDPQYLTYVEQYFKKIYQQCKGLLFKDGGPIIGVQIENEYGHAGGRSGAQGRAHMQTLKEMLLAIGFDLPYYTATAWGGTVVIDQETLPVFGGYIDAPWAQTLKPLPANDNFLITPYFDDPLIANDFNESMANQPTTNDLNKYPILTAELGGGLQVTKHRRPLVEAGATEAQVLAKLASGANGLGYYMYHGGTNPLGKKSTLQESTATGSYTDVPILSYDFQAPIRESGLFHQSYRRLRKLHLFIKSFERLLTLSQPIFPNDYVTDPEDTTAIRYSIRHCAEVNGGFLFINHYQRDRCMERHDDVQFQIELNQEIITIPPLTVTNGYKAILPYNVPIKNSVIKSANASLLCQLADETVIFYHSEPSQAAINVEGDRLSYIVISEQDANNALLINGKLYVTSADQWFDQENRYVLSPKPVETDVYPEKRTITTHFDRTTADLVYQQQITDQAFCQYQLDLAFSLSKDTYDLLLKIDFIGDQAVLFADGARIADWFANGEQWVVPLRRFQYPEQLTLNIYPTCENVYYEMPMPEGCEATSIKVEPIYFKSYPLKK